MTGREELLLSVDLIERLEKATGPDRELDGEIWLAADPRLVVLWPHWTAEQRDNMVPRYTASIDAALSLVPEHHRWLLDKRPYADHRIDGYRCEVYRQAHYYATTDDMPHAWSATPALALTIAALKARRNLP